MNIIYHNPVMCGQLNLIARSLIQLTIKHNLTQDQRGTLSPQLNLICNMVYGYSIHKLDLTF